MKINKNSICALIAVVLVAVFLNVTVVLASGELYLPSGDAMADVRNALSAARDSEKLVLVV